MTGLILRTCRADMTSHGGFVWPRSGHVAAPDWSPTPSCGGGLHGLLDGQGDGSLLSWLPDAVWLVVRPDGPVVDLGGKVKFAAGDVLFAGDRAGALALLRGHGVTGALPGDVVAAGHYGTATAGYGGTATAGHRGTATAGDAGTASAGYGGTASAGDYGTASAGDYGTASAGNRGTATAGNRGTASAGDYGVISIAWFDGRRRRIAIGYVGEDGIEPDTPYRVVGGRLIIKAHQ